MCVTKTDHMSVHRHIKAHIHVYINTVLTCSASVVVIVFVVVGMFDVHLSMKHATICRNVIRLVHFLLSLRAYTHSYSATYSCHSINNAPSAAAGLSIMLLMLALSLSAYV